MAKRKIKKFKFRRPKKKRTIEEKEAFLKAKALEMSEKKTWPELEFERLLEDLGVEFRTQEIVGGKIFDFYIPSENLLVEIDGDYWHGNPKYYARPNKMQNTNRKNDRKKNLIAEQNGYKISRVWESDLKDNFGIQKGRFKRILKWKKKD